MLVCAIRTPDTGLRAILGGLKTNFNQIIVRVYTFYTVQPVVVVVVVVYEEG